MNKLSKLRDNQATWEIAWEGYYITCSNCRFEPDYDTIIKGLPKKCPKCQKTMMNSKKLSVKSHKIC